MAFDHQMNFQLDESTYTQLRRCAFEQKKSLADILRIALEKYLKEYYKKGRGEEDEKNMYYH